MARGGGGAETGGEEGGVGGQQQAVYQQARKRPSATGPGCRRPACGSTAGPGRSAASNANYRQEYETLVAELGYTPTLDVQGFIKLELRESLAASLQTALTL